MSPEHLLSRATAKVLDERTPDGLFVTFEGTYFWVFSDFHDRYAVQLTATRERPAFSFYWLSVLPLANGLHLGSVKLEFGSPYEGSRNNRAGLIFRKGLRVFLKASNPSGRAVPLMILPYWYEKDPCQSIFYSDWHLEVSGCGPVRQVFSGPAIPVQLKPHEDLQATSRLQPTSTGGSVRDEHR